MSNHRPTADEDVPAGTFTQLLVLEELLPDGDYAREPSPYLAGFAAGKAFVRYRRAGEGKRSPMPDFHIGAHAVVASYRLLLFVTL